MLLETFKVVSTMNKDKINMLNAISVCDYNEMMLLKGICNL